MPWFRFSEHRRKRLLYKWAFADARLRGLTWRDARRHARAVIEREVFV
jgi:hypothetical protein